MYCLLYYGCFVCGICCICLLFSFILLVVYKSKDSLGLLLVVSQFQLLSGYGDCTRYRPFLLRHLISFYHYCFVWFDLIWFDLWLPVTYNKSNVYYFSLSDKKKPFGITDHEKNIDIICGLGCWGYWGLQ